MKKILAALREGLKGNTGSDWDFDYIDSYISSARQKEEDNNSYAAACGPCVTRKLTAEERRRYGIEEK